MNGLGPWFQLSGRTIDLLKSPRFRAVKTLTAPKCGSTPALGSGRPRARRPPTFQPRVQVGTSVAPRTTKGADVDGILTVVTNCCQKSVVSQSCARTTAT